MGGEGGRIGGPYQSSATIGHVMATRTSPPKLLARNLGCLRGDGRRLANGIRVRANLMSAKSQSPKEVSSA